MLYLDENNINNLSINWKDTILKIEESVELLKGNDYVQPVKPYLRYKNLTNRIIAMPSYVGGNINMAGIKWIASFPDNIKRGLPRAHSVTILNDADTGIPKCIINTPLASIIRTASVSGLVIDKFLNSREKRKEISIGIVGFGPIGRYHYQLCKSYLKDYKLSFYVFDIDKKIKTEHDNSDFNGVIFCSSWQEVYLNTDIFITCTVSSERYINEKPKEGSLHLNVSLRDYQHSTFKYFKDSIFVDNWEEVCRENTDIEMYSKTCGLKEDKVNTIVEIVVDNYLKDIPSEMPIQFNPMGMSIFDISIATHLYNKANELGVGTCL